MTLRNPGNLQVLLRNADNRALQLAMAGMAAMLLHARGNRELEEGARPILMLEDPESRLHPTMLALAWGLLEQLPGQKLLTTNSGTCSLPCRSIRCAAWCDASMTSSATSWGERYSSDDLRKIAFHVRINRPMSMFARCWLLVEETEIWLLSSSPRSVATACGRRGCASSSLPSAVRPLSSRWPVTSASSGTCSPTATRRAPSTRARLVPAQGGA